jgi:hypothetical protein
MKITTNFNRDAALDGVSNAPRAGFALKAY